MPLMRKSSVATLAREAIVLDLGDLAAQGELLKAQARAEAERIIAEAQAERNRLIAGAVEEGRKQGIAQGVQEGGVQGEAAGKQAALVEFRERLTKLEAAWVASLAAFESDRDTLILDA